MADPVDPLSREAPAELRRPASPAELFLAFNRLSLQGFGGVLPVAQRELCERRQWLTRTQFVELLAVAQVLPGPNVVNLSLMYGDRQFGWRGALAALSGMLATPLLIVVVLASVYGHYAQLPMVAGALRGMGAVAAGLIIATAFKLLGALRTNVLGRVWAGLGAAAAFGLVLAHLPLLWVVSGVGGLACVGAWARLAR